MARLFPLVILNYPKLRHSQTLSFKLNEMNKTNIPRETVLMINCQDTITVKLEIYFISVVLLTKIMAYLNNDNHYYLKKGTFNISIKR